jgi:hypothetical protein
MKLIASSRKTGGLLESGIAEAGVGESGIDSEDSSGG